MSDVGPYELIERIGMGGMAEVFKASQSGEEGFERIVAVKRILPNLSADPDFEKMFIDEAKIAVQLQHPNIAQIYDLGRDGDSLFIAMEYVPGRDMATIIERQMEVQGRTLPLSFVVQVVIKVCEALHHAHAAKGSFGQRLNLIHRDITPQNILVSFEGAVKVVDFGLAKAAGRLVQTQAGVVKGKLAYLSAEQARGEDVDSRSDIYSLGTCFYEWLTGQRLFLRRNDADTVMAVQRSEVPPLRAIRPELPQALDAVVRRALQPDPRNRYQTAGEMQEELLSFAMEAGMPVRRRRLVEVLSELYPGEVEKPAQPQLAPAPPQPPPPPRPEEPHTREIPDIGAEEETADETVPRDTIPAPHDAIPQQDDYEDSTAVLLEADEAVMQVLSAPGVPEEARQFEDEVSAVPVVEHDSSTDKRPSPPPGRAPLTDSGPRAMEGESTGDFAHRADELARSADARGDLVFDEPTKNYSEEDILKALANGPPESSGLPREGELSFDEPTAAYSKEMAAALLSRAPRKKGAEDALEFTDQTVEEKPSDELEEMLDELEPLEGEATRTDGSSDD